jgi:hypothetical protein
MKKTNTNKGLKKLIPAAGMLMLSAAMLGTSTFAWFTMNKEVTVTGMELKAHSEEGLLINEVKLATSGTWDDAAQAAGTPTTFELRPTSSYNLADWWHANSKKSADEAGLDAKTDTVVVNSTTGAIYTSLSTATDQTIIGAEGATSGDKATGNTQAETHVFYTDASYGIAGSYQNGEGYYVRYTYYLKSSGQEDFVVTDLQAKVKATKKDSTATTNKLDPALRVGIAVPEDNGSSTIAGRKIFSPIPGSTELGVTDTSYTVTKDVNGDTSESVTPTVATTLGEYTAYATLNLNDATSGEPLEITIPKVTSNGIPVYVYVWFEGEDTHCMSDNLTATLNAYDIDITFNNNNIGGSGTTAP